LLGSSFLRLAMMKPFDSPIHPTRLERVTFGFVVRFFLILKKLKSPANTAIPKNNNLLHLSQYLPCSQV
jgi:hypothetical protein